MTIPSIHMKDVLVAEGYTFAGAADWAIYIGKMQDKPDRQIVIYDAPGLNPDPKWLLDFPAVQIKARGGPNDYAATSSKIVDVKNRLLGRASFDAIDGSQDRIVSIRMIGDMSFLDWDENGRPTFVMNLSLIIEPKAVAGTQRTQLV